MTGNDALQSRQSVFSIAALLACTRSTSVDQPQSSCALAE
jgi:hypothetical protein